VRQASREHSGGVELAERLRKRRTEIEEATRTRIYAVSVLPRAGGPEYAEGLRSAVSAALEYGLEGIERGEERAPPVPEALFSQARLAARSGVSLDTVLRRYFAGHTLLEDFLIEEVEREELLGPAALKRLLRSQAAIVDRLLAAVSKAYTEEAERRPRSSEHRRAERIERLLGGEMLDTGELGYDFEARHLGIVASGPRAEEVLATFAGSLEARLLTVPREEGTTWAWLGSRRRLDPAAFQGSAEELPAGLSLAIGEPGEGLAGWRLTHRQARAALSIAIEGADDIVRYANVALLASIRQDEVLLASLQQLYLAPLAEERDGGVVARQTLQAYFAAERNVSSAAMALGVNRNTVASRLRAIEKRLGRPLTVCAVDLEAALRLEGIGQRPLPAGR
jgi:PucR C-terminal helix-turn-helix domain/GGDEF-like domain